MAFDISLIFLRSFDKVHFGESGGSMRRICEMLNTYKLIPMSENSLVVHFLETIHHLDFQSGPFLSF